MSGIDPAVLVQLPLEEISEVVFFKRDEITTDLICCEVAVGERVWFFHEEAEGWGALVRHLEALPDFRTDWFGMVAQSPFAESRTIAFSRE